MNSNRDSRKRITKAVIAAGGSGTRFYPVTNTVPKEMLPVNHKPLIQLAVEELVSCGIQMITIVISPDKLMIRDYFTGGNPAGLHDAVDIRYVVQEKPRGLGHAVGLTRDSVDANPFILLLPDDVFIVGESPLGKMMEIYEQYGGSAVAIGRVLPTEVSRYGIIRANKLDDRIYRVKSLTEKPAQEKAASDLAVFGRYILSPDIFQILRNTKTGRNGEIQLTDALDTLSRTGPVFGYEFTGNRYDCGTPEGWVETNVNLGVPREYMERLLEDLRTGIVDGLDQGRG